MKYIKTYEGYGYEWKNIYEKDGKLYIHLYKLASEMEESAKGDKYIVAKKENEYCKLVKKLLRGNVITFSCADCSKKEHTGICDRVEFHSGLDSTPDDVFQLEYIHIKLENMKGDENIEDDKVIVHLDTDPEIYRETQKYNL